MAEFPLIANEETRAKAFVSYCERLAEKSAFQAHHQLFCPFDLTALICMALQHRDIPASTIGWGACPPPCLPAVRRRLASFWWNRVHPLAAAPCEETHIL
ncbi:hypothetical protein [Sphingobium sp. HWE2-09]|uniref:hypothetical protein n=1 Tax=Sphingobium sp. HWE2-09 TaxID=3108390 RepID=UPI002DC0BC64|nr:hypothetical protein [Sphingobium sp. HWE2-09]